MKFPIQCNYQYRPLKARYGAWHGFDEQIFLQIVTRSVGERLGY